MSDKTKTARSIVNSLLSEQNEEPSVESGPQEAGGKLYKFQYSTEDVGPSHLTLSARANSAEEALHIIGAAWGEGEADESFMEQCFQVSSESEVVDGELVEKYSAPD